MWTEEKKKNLSGARHEEKESRHRGDEALGEEMVTEGERTRLVATEDKKEGREEEREEGQGER